MSQLLVAEHVSKSFGEFKALNDVSIEVPKGSVFGLLGPNGAGKTTLLQILGTLDDASTKQQSELKINEVSIIDLSEKQLAKFRNETLGFIFQFHQLLPEFTALENVCIPAFIKGTPKAQTENRAKELLDFLGLSHRYDHKPNELSGGEQQRVAVARALINSPELIFADEPSGNLDSESAENLHNLFFKLRDEFGQTFVIVTHNEELADMADRKLVMVDGKIIT